MTTSENVISWRKRTKQRMVSAFGGKCGICGYNRFVGALEFHHCESNEKERTLSGMIVNPAAWIKIVKELRKCVCLCSICHREVHGGLLTIPENIIRFDEMYAEYRNAYSKEMEPCPVCRKEKWAGQKTCSYECAAKLAGKFNWDLFDLHDLYIVNKMTQRAIAKMIGCSDVAVRKRLIKLGLKSK